MPRIAVITCVRNEADVLEAFVRRALSFADTVTVTDHGSIDGTPAILELLRQEGLPVAVRRLDGPAQRQSETLNALLRESDADWIVPLDADECLTATEGSVRDAILGLPAPTAAITRTLLTYVPDGRRLKKALAYPKVVAVPKALKSAGVLTPGSHGFLVDKKEATADTARIVMRHVPVRSPDQAKAKAVGWLNHLLRRDAKPEEAVHWRTLFGLYTEGKLETDRDAAAWALTAVRMVDPDCPPDLVEEPLPRTKLRYGHLATRPPARAVLDALARELGVEGAKKLPEGELAAGLERYILGLKGVKPY